MNLKQIEKEIEKQESKRQELLKSYHKLDEQLTRIHNKIKKLKEDKSKIIIRRKGIDWEYLLNEGNGQTAYDEKVKQLRKLNLSSGGYIPETNQYVLSFYLYRDDDKRTTEIHKNLNKMLKYLKPFKHKEFKDKVIFIDFMEKGLSEYAAYNLYYFPKTKKAQVCMMRYHSFSEVTKPDTLLNTLKYIQKNLWYQRNEKDY